MQIYVRAIIFFVQMNRKEKDKMTTASFPWFGFVERERLTHSHTHAHEWYWFCPIFNGSINTSANTLWKKDIIWSVIFLQICKDLNGKLTSNIFTKSIYVFSICLLSLFLVYICTKLNWIESNWNDRQIYFIIRTYDGISERPSFKVPNKFQKVSSGLSCLNVFSVYRICFEIIVSSSHTYTLTHKIFFTESKIKQEKTSERKSNDVLIHGFSVCRCASSCVFELAVFR